MKTYDDNKDLIKQLRNNKVTLGHGEYGVDPLCELAANELEAMIAQDHVIADQQAEIEGLRMIIKDLERRLDHAEWLVDKYREEEETK